MSPNEKAENKIVYLCVKVCIIVCDCEKKFILYLQIEFRPEKLSGFNDNWWFRRVLSF